ncbi:MAG: 5'/3'-nucleotidase SurE [Cryomorphaceae bacterium]|nr:5'/3'-nucleotidase SurE [Cryomorphaceae bacterium]
MSSKGIRSLVEVAVNFGEVVVVAPDKAQSGMGHAITVNQILRLDKSDIFKEVEAFTCSGTPVDCVKLSISEVLHRRPDLILSGINHGENTSTNVLYSGTMSAAVEGAMENIPSIGFSLSDFNSDADFSGSQLIAKTIIEKVLSESMPEHVCLNVNVPKLPSAELKGFQICRQAHAFWEDRFDKRVDQFGRPYFWLTGDFVRKDADEGTDLHALKNGFASVVPTQFDMTAYKVMDQFKNWNK